MQAKQRVSAPQRSQLIGSTLAAHAERDLPLPRAGRRCDPWPHNHVESGECRFNSSGGEIGLKIVVKAIGCAALLIIAGLLVIVADRMFARAWMIAVLAIHLCLFVAVIWLWPAPAYLPDWKVGADTYGNIWSIDLLCAEHL
jgi:hypothetical protein